MLDRRGAMRFLKADALLDNNNASLSMHNLNILPRKGVIYMKQAINARRAEIRRAYHAANRDAINAHRAEIRKLKREARQ